jgi:hypothetical protein
VLGLVIRTSWVWYRSRTTSLVTLGNSLYFDCLVHWMRRKTEIPCICVYASASKRHNKRQNYWAYMTHNCSNMQKLTIQSKQKIIRMDKQVYASTCMAQVPPNSHILSQWCHLLHQ